MLCENEAKLFEADAASVITRHLRAVVAIPVCNEVERVGDCLEALGNQAGLEASDLGVLLFLNNCTDGTAHVVASLHPSLLVRLRVIERTFAEANAGWARREAMEAAAGWLEEAGASGGVILTTDADSRVPRDWVAQNLAALATGVDAVAEDAARLPAALHARGRLEGAYETLLTELEAIGRSGAARSLAAALDDLGCDARGPARYLPSGWRHAGHCGWGGPRLRVVAPRQRRTCSARARDHRGDLGPPGRACPW